MVMTIISISSRLFIVQMNKKAYKGVKCNYPNSRSSNVFMLPSQKKMNYTIFFVVNIVKSHMRSLPNHSLKSYAFG